MKITTIMAVMFAGFIAAGQCHGQPTDSLPEKYVKKVLIEAKWGDGPGEFGKDDNENEMGLHYGPTDIASDGKGNVYIVDFINERLQILNTAGNVLSIFKLYFVNESGERSFLVRMVVDEEGAIYILWKVPVYIPYSKNKLKTYKYELKQYDWYGKIINQYKLTDDFFSKRAPKFLNKATNRPPKEVIQEFGGPVNLRIAGDKILVENIIIATKSKGFLGESAIIDTSYPKRKGFAAADKYGNVFFGLTKIIKYSPDDKLLAIINTSERCIYGAVYARYIDILGNIYAMENDKSILRVVKYEKQ